MALFDRKEQFKIIHFLVEKEMSAIRKNIKKDISRGGHFSSTLAFLLIVD